MVGPRNSRPTPETTQHIACIGTGVIGSGWAAYFLARGYDVVAWDPAPEAERHLFEMVDIAWPVLEELGLGTDAARSRLTFAPSLAAAVANAQFIQESAPERLELKVELLAELDAATAPDIVIASSTSGFLMSDMQATLQHPSRTVVGHPFNPPYLIPLVEVAGGSASDADAVAWAEAFYRSAGKEVVRLRCEVPGFIANRLQQALWHEALHMLAAGEATVAEIDLSVAAGPGLRWAIMGPCLTFHLAGGDGGMAYMLDHFNPELAAPWTRLKSPELSETLRQTLVDGSESVAHGRSITDLVRDRDRYLISILRALDTVRGSRPTTAGQPT